MSDLCYLCLGAPAQRTIAGYGFGCCEACYKRAESGWAKHHEPSLYKAMERQGLLIPDRNERGLLPREYSPPADFAL